MRCAADWPVRSVFRTVSLPQGGAQVLGANLKCSESRALGGLPIDVPDQDSTRRWGRRRGFPNHVRLCEASAEHSQQCAEFPLLRNRGLGPLAVRLTPHASMPTRQAGSAAKNSNSFAHGASSPAF
jgi:hypothetical protein